jgi:Major Facilitator Superfamily
VADSFPATVGALIDRFGGHVVMPFGSLIGALGLVGLVAAQKPWLYFGVWVVLGVAMAASLYDPAFASIARIFGAAARTPITALTLVAGFASTVSWPATQFLIGSVGWRGTYLVYAALLAFLAAPLHAFALPRRRAEAGGTGAGCGQHAGGRAAAAGPPFRPSRHRLRVLCVRAVGVVSAAARDF